MNTQNSAMRPAGAPGPPAPRPAGPGRRVRRGPAPGAGGYPTPLTRCASSGPRRAGCPANGGQVDGLGHRAERAGQLRREDGEVARPLPRLLDGEGAPGDAGVDSDGLRRGEDGPAEELVPDGQCEAEIDVLCAVESMVDAVEVGA